MFGEWKFIICIRLAAKEAARLCPWEKMKVAQLTRGRETQAPKHHHAERSPSKPTDRVAATFRI